MRKEGLQEDDFQGGIQMEDGEIMETSNFWGRKAINNIKRGKKQKTYLQMTDHFFIPSLPPTPIILTKQ